MTTHTDVDVLTALVAHTTLWDLDGTLNVITPGPPAAVHLARSFGDDNRAGLATLARWATSLDAATATRTTSPGGSPRLVVAGTLQATSRDVHLRVILDVADTTEPDAILPIAYLTGEQVAA